MQPVHWQPSVELPEQEEHIMRRIRKAKLFVFLRYHRHELLDEAFRASNWRVCTKPVSEVSHPLLQHNWHWQPLYKPTRVSQMMRSGTATLMDRRWQLVLDCLDTDQAPFSKGTLVGFRQRLIAAHLDRRLIERTIEMANQSQAFGSRALRAALDSSPLWGAGR